MSARSTDKRARASGSSSLNDSFSVENSLDAACTSTCATLETAGFDRRTQIPLWAVCAIRPGEIINAEQKEAFLPSISMKELLEAGVHFGHQTKRWNPKMKEYIFGERNGIYIIDLQKTLKMFKEASKFVADLAAAGKIVLFVGTKRQAQDAIAEEAGRCQQFYVNQRWLGGLLTNMTTVQRSIKRLKELDRKSV